jgi:NADH-quinone oxidoreductase subunit C
MTDTDTPDATEPDGAGTAAETVAPVHPVPDHPVLAGLAGDFPAVRFEHHHGDDVAHVAPDDLAAFVEACRDAGYENFLDLCAVDYLRRSPRFEVVINLLSHQHVHRLRIRVGVAGGEPAAPSITGVYPGANFYEREAYDLFGIEFTGHPDLTRILLPDDWEGYPLRKDVSVGSVPVQFKEVHKAP